MDALIFDKFPIRLNSIIRKAIILIVVFLFVVLSRGKVFAQVRVTGHVFAEIVEPAMLSAKANNNHVVYKNENAVPSGFVLAEITLTDGVNTNVGILIQNTQLEGKNGETYSFSTSFGRDYNENNGYDDSRRELFQLNGVPQQDLASASNNLLTGRYEVTFMYN